MQKKLDTFCFPSKNGFGSGIALEENETSMLNLLSCLKIGGQLIIYNIVFYILLIIT